MDQDDTRALAELAELVRGMRREQRAYFDGDRTIERLQASKACERTVDRWLERYAESARQPTLPNVSRR